MDYKILLAFIPLIGWAFGDFFIQRTSRKVGAVNTLFYICFLSLLLTPLVWTQIFQLTPSQITGLTGMGFLVFIYALVLFHAFEITKLSVTESVVALELPITVAFAVFVGKETLTTTYLFFFIIICFGVFLAATKSFKHFGSHLKSGKNIFEKGVLLAFLATILSAMANYYIGLSAQLTSPLVAVWFMHFVVLILCLIYLIATREIIYTYRHFLDNKKNVILASFFDNIAWIGYAYAVIVIPISLAVTISEAYIVLAAYLGYYFNKEKLSSHQKIGATIALIGVVILSYISEF